MLLTLSFSWYSTYFVIPWLNNKSSTIVSGIMIRFFCFTFRFKRKVLYDARHDQEESVLGENFTSTNQSSSTKRQQPRETNPNFNSNKMSTNCNLCMKAHQACKKENISKGSGVDPRLPSYQCGVPPILFGHFFLKTT